MCGIAGIVSLRGAPVEEKRLERMADSLAHRGPDGAGVWTRGPVGLCHRRLAIVDPANGAQPLADERGQIHVVYNGEIYNHLALRRGLAANGHVFRTGCDTETLLHLYQQEGERAVETLNGMFAFALWDSDRRSLLLARDRLGIKPLYYALRANELLFASEIKALLAAGVPAEFDEQVLPEFLATRFLSGPRTFFRGIRKLLPGRTLTWSAESGLRERRYWRITVPEPAARSEGSIESLAPQLLERLDHSVQTHLMADVPVGVFLSGGIDSSAIALLAARHLPGLKTFSVGFAEAEANELSWARQVATAIGSDHHETVVSADRFFDALPRMIWHEDEPIAFTSSIPLWFLASLARSKVKAVLTGEGADELFLGYNRYRVTAWNERLGRALARVPFATRALRAACGRLPRRFRRITARTALELPAGPRSLFFDNFSVFRERAQRGLLADRAMLEGDPFAEGLALYEEAGGDSLDRMSATDLQTYLVELLMKQDQMSMAASIESRVPFLDHELVEWALSLPSEVKLRGRETKAVLRAAFRGLLPGEILTRPKMGFPVPLGRWLRERPRVLDDILLEPRSLARGWFVPREVARIVDEHKRGTADHTEQLWLLIGLELWQRIFLEQRRGAGANAERAA